MTRLLITGGTGFVGAACVRNALARGHEVHVLSRSPRNLPPGVIPHAVDLLTDRAAALLREVRPTHLAHLAWIATPGSYWTSPQNAEWVWASLGLLADFADTGGQRAVISGSCAEYDWSGGGVLDEGGTALKPNTLYGQAKADLHRQAAAVADVRGLSLAWARLFFLYGPGEHPDRLVPYVTRQLLAGEPALCSDGTQRRDFLHIDDAADALICLLLGTVTGPVNVASGQGRPVAEVIDRVAAAVGRTGLVRLGSKPASAGEPPELVGAVARLNDEVGWRSRIPIEDGLTTTVQWWRERDDPEP